MIDTTLIKTLEALARKERKIKEFKRRVRMKCKVVSKGITKNGNISLKVEKEGENCSFTVLKSHRERFALAGKLETGKMVSIAGIPKFRMVICTLLKPLEKVKGVEMQEKLKSFLGTGKD